MAPAAVRTPTRKAIAALPETSRLNFLCAASKLVSETAPELSSYLGSRALQVNFASYVWLLRLWVLHAQGCALPIVG